MNDGDRNSEDEEKFFFKSSEKPDLSEYNGLERFEFKTNQEKPDLREYEGLEAFEFRANQEISDLSEYNELEIFEFEENPEKLEYHKYNRLKGFECNISSTNSFKQRNYDGVEENEIENGEFLNEEDKIISNETPIIIIKEMGILNINLTNFQEEVMENIKKIIKSLECKMEKKKIILIKSGEILNKHIARARKVK